MSSKLFVLACVLLAIVGTMPIQAQGDETDPNGLPSCDIAVDSLDADQISEWRGRARQVGLLRGHIDDLANDGETLPAQFAGNALQWAMVTEMRIRARPIDTDDLPDCVHYEVLLEALDNMVDDSFKTFGYLWYLNEVEQTDEFVEGGREAAGALVQDVQIWELIYEIVDPGYYDD